MIIEGSIPLVTGANRGLGRHFSQQLLVLQPQLVGSCPACRLCETGIHRNRCVCD